MGIKLRSVKLSSLEEKIDKQSKDGQRGIIGIRSGCGIPTHDSHSGTVRQFSYFRFYDTRIAIHTSKDILL